MGKRDTMQPGNIKGSGMLGLVKGLRTGGEPALAAVPERLRHYVVGEKRIVSSHWYPDDDFMGLAEAVFKIMPDPGIDRWEAMGRLGAKSDFSSVYAPLVKVGDPAMTLTFLPAGWQQYHDRGTVRVEVEGEDAGRGKAQVDIGQYLTGLDTFCRLQAGHITELILAAEATEAKVTVVHTATAERAARFEATWKI